MQPVARIRRRVDDCAHNPAAAADGGLRKDCAASSCSAPCSHLVLAQVPPPVVRPNAPLQLLATNIDFDTHLGRIAIGRVTSGAGCASRVLQGALQSVTRAGHQATGNCLSSSPWPAAPARLTAPPCRAALAGTIRKGQPVAICSSLEPGKVRAGKVNELYVYDNFARVPVEEVEAGDICALSGIPDIAVRRGAVHLRRPGSGGERVRRAAPSRLAVCVVCSRRTLC